ncbi:MAG: tandem-95 repeat protein, partial [Gammaproteobacteria bacterium]|nr:tandem-95 repeat protein [Gammaproteobacteria bacterium]
MTQDFGLSKLSQRFSRWFAIGLLASSSFSLFADQCELYPITLPTSLFANNPDKLTYEQVPLGTGPGNYSWLTWDGANDAPSLAQSLIPPGDSERYQNPEQADDNEVSIGDWVQGRPGVKNSRDIRDNLTALLGRNIRIPAWSSNRGQGSLFDYQTGAFIEIELTDFKLNGKGWISFIYKGPATCESTPNSPPVAENLNLQVEQDTALGITVIAADADDDPLTYRIVQAPQNGTLTGNGPDYVYTPNPGFIGSDSFSFVANDGQEDSNIAVATISVTEIPNSPPVAENLNLQVEQDTALGITVIATDADADPLTYRIEQAPQNGTLTGTGPDYIYTPDPGFIGTDSFSFVANDGQADSNVAVATIAVTEAPNNPPIAEDLNAELTQDTSVDILVIASDADEDVLSYLIVLAPVNGTLTGNGPNYVYTPDPGFIGSDSFSFVANDGKVDSNVATATITVSPAPNNPPVAEDLQLTVTSGSDLDLTVIANDLDEDPLTYVIVDAPQNGTLSGTGPDYVYTPDPGFVGDDSFSFLANDGQVDSNIAVASITVAPLPNNPPVAENLELQVTTGSNLDLTVIASDLDDDPLTYVIVDAPQNGTLSGTGPDYVYTPNPGFIGDDSFSFLANDGQINSNIALASITVSPLPNNPPVAEDLELQVTTGNDLDLTVIASDLDDDPLSYVIVDAPQNGTL